MTDGVPMRLVYFAPADIQLARVDRQCIVYFCSALARIGVDVELVALRIRVMPGEEVAGHPLDLYRGEHRFKTRLVRVPVRQVSGDRWLALNRLVAHCVAALSAVFRRRRPGALVFYAKTYSTTVLLLAIRGLSRSRPLVVFEAHTPPANRWHRLVLRAVDRVVANTEALRSDLIAAGHVGRDMVIGTHQGIDLDVFEGLRISRKAARERLGLAVDEQLVIYTGKVYGGSGEVEYLLAAARLLEADHNISLVLVGGRNDHALRLRDRVTAERRTNVKVVGFVRPSAVQDYQFAADVLVLYYPSGMELNGYRSPGKLFEYMAAARPIVAVDLPVLREILGQEPAAAMVPPDSPSLLAETILRLLADHEEAERLATAARRRVAGFTWERRAETITSFIRDSPSWPQRPRALERARRRAA